MVDESLDLKDNEFAVAMKAWPRESGFFTLHRKLEVLGCVTGFVSLSGTVWKPSHENGSGSEWMLWR